MKTLYSKYSDRTYYTKNVPIGLLSLIYTIVGNNIFENDTSLRKSMLTLYSDHMAIFVCARRVRDAIGKKDSLGIAIDATSYYFFLRIFLDSFTSTFHYFMRKLHPSNSRFWPPIRSFSVLTSWFSDRQNKSNDDLSIIKDFSTLRYLEVLDRAREIRNQLKTRPNILSSRRLAHEKMNDEVNIVNLKKDLKDTLFVMLSTMDYIGDYFFRNLLELKNVARIDFNKDKYPVGFLHPEERKIYYWFNAS